MIINLIKYFEQTVTKYAGKTAVIEGDQRITFKSLDEKAKIISNHIAALCNNTINKPVAVYLGKSINSVCADIGITFSGNAYMNLDVKSPLERVGNVLQLIQPVIIIVDNANLEKCKEVSKALPNVILLNIDEIDFTKEADNNISKSLLSKIIDTDPYCLINTSGSTGTPKSVVLNHKSFVDFTEWARDTFKFSDDEIIGSLSPLIFDIYSYELCMLMSQGHTIVLIPETWAAFPVNILKLLKEQQVTFLFWVPTIMVNIANMNLLEQVALPDLKTIWFAGEVFPTKQFNYWKRNLPQALFANLYGPIEITLDCTYFIVDRDVKDDEPLPIGFACRNTDILILNDKNELATEGEEGELCVRGTSLAMGYYNNPEKTANAFVQNPLNKSYPETIYRTGDIVATNTRGEIIFKGRKDSLIKHLGYRIELGEIEHVIINTLKIAKNGCVVYNFAKKEITMFYESPEEIPAAEFRKLLAGQFPKYMIPTNYILMEEMPRNPNGKIDRLLLSNKINNNG
jgi:amino acid adenylation domain-containing protein